MSVAVLEVKESLSSLSLFCTGSTADEALDSLSAQNLDDLLASSPDSPPAVTHNKGFNGVYVCVCLCVCLCVCVFVFVFMDEVLHISECVNEFILQQVNVSTCLQMY